MCSIYIYVLYAYIMQFLYTVICFPIHYFRCIEVYDDMMIVYEVFATRVAHFACQPAGCSHIGFTSLIFTNYVACLQPSDFLVLFLPKKQPFMNIRQTAFPNICLYWGLYIHTIVLLLLLLVRPVPTCIVFCGFGSDIKVLMITQQIPSLDPALPMVDQLDTLSLIENLFFFVEKKASPV